MDGTNLTNAAARLNELADEIDEFTNTASERAAQVADNVREVATDLRSMGEAVAGTTGAVETTPPEGEVVVETTTHEDEPPA